MNRDDMTRQDFLGGSIRGLLVAMLGSLTAFLWIRGRLSSDCQGRCEGCGTYATCRLPNRTGRKAS